MIFTPPVLRRGKRRLSNVCSGIAVGGTIFMHFVCVRYLCNVVFVFAVVSWAFCTPPA